MATDRTPPALQRIVDFVNTREVDGDVDALGEPSQLDQWLAENDLLPSGKNHTVTAADLDLAVAIREELREALVANHDHAGTQDRTPPAGEAISAITFTVRLGPDGAPRLTPADNGIKQALGRLLEPLPAAAADGSWARTKVCPSDTCLWAFYDQSRNRSRRWCSMEVCGNREKSRAFRERHDTERHDT